MLNHLPKSRLPQPEQALKGRPDSMPVSSHHFVNKHPLKPPFPPNLQQAMFGMGCFWGAERRFWEQPGVYTTAVGYAAGYTPNPTYQEVCSGMTGHNEVVLVIFDPQQVGYRDLLKIFWENHNPTQGMRQGNDSGTQYRSGIYTFGAQQETLATTTRDQFAAELRQQGLGPVTTEIRTAPEFYYAEDYHQQYLAKNPHGYCGLGGTGIRLPADA